jgi:glycosyltransferase involved in cell wall biosynthesis
MLSNQKRLVVISSGFPNESGDYLAHTFVKGFVDEAKHYYKDILVVVLIPYIPSIVSKFINKNNISLVNYSYDNVKIIYNKYPFIPIWPFSKYKGRIAHLFLSSKISKLMDKGTLVHANFTSPAGVFANYLTKNRENSYTLTVHEDHNWLVSEVNSNNPTLIDTWKNAKTIIRVNKLDNKLLSKFNNNVVTIPNGYNHRKFKLLDKNTCKTELNIDAGKNVIVNIGFYKDQKNQKLLIESIDLLPNSLKENLECFIIGGGPKQKELEELVVYKNLESVIKIVGQVKQDRLPLYLNAANLFCLSSNSEGNPTVMFEALGVGIPYIGTNVGGVPEIIISEKYGLLCEPNNKTGLKEIIEKALIKNWDKDEIIEYSKRFSWKNIFLETQKHY